MTQFQELLNIILNFVNNFILIDFSNYSGALNPTLITIYEKMTIVIPYLVLIVCVGLLFKLLFFLFGGFKKV